MAGGHLTRRGRLQLLHHIHKHEVLRGLAAQSLLDSGLVWLQAFCFTPREVKLTPFPVFQGSVEIAADECKVLSAMYMQSFDHQVQPATQPQDQLHLIPPPAVLACFGALFFQPPSCFVCDSSIPSNPSLQCDGGRGQSKMTFPAPPFPKLGVHQLGDSLV